MPARWLRTATMLPQDAIAVATIPITMPSAASLPCRAAAISGRNMSVTPATPTTAAMKVGSASGVPNAIRAPIGFMKTIVENSTATSPEVAYCSAQYTAT